MLQSAVSKLGRTLTPVTWARTDEGDNSDALSDASASFDHQPTDSPMEPERTMVSFNVQNTEAFHLRIATEVADGHRLSKEEGIVSMVNACMGTALLSIGYNFRKVGIIWGLLLMLVSAIFTRSALLGLMDCIRQTRCVPTYAAVAREAFGLPGRIFVLLHQILSNFGFLMVYVLGAHDAISQFFNIQPDRDTQVHELHIPIFLFTMLLCVPPTLQRNITDLAKWSFFACGAILVTAVSITLFSFFAGTQDHPVRQRPSLRPSFQPKSEEDIMRLWPGWSNLIAAVPVFTVYFAINDTGSIILATLKDTRAIALSRCTYHSYCSVYFLQAGLGCIIYGCLRDETNENILSNFRSGGVFLRLVEISVSIVMVGSYVLLFQPCRMSLLDLLFQKVELFKEASCCQFYWVTALVNIAVAAAAHWVATHHRDDVEQVLGTLYYLHFVLPAVILLRLHKSHYLGVPIERRVWKGLVSLLGVMAFTASSYQIINSFYRSSFESVITTTTTTTWHKR